MNDSRYSVAFELRYYDEVFRDIYMQHLNILHKCNIKVKRAVENLGKCEKDIQALRSGDHSASSIFDV